ncbi:MAG: plastocyanin/azurin family copper-binding protein [Thermoplasmata archaeon]
MSTKGVSTAAIVGSVAIIVVLGIAAFFFLTAPGDQGGEIKTFTINGVESADGLELSFDLPSITVNAGDTVEITFVNPDENNQPHTFTLDRFGVNTGFISPGESKTVTFTATESGSHAYYCAVAGHQELGMEGILVAQG